VSVSGIGWLGNFLLSICVAPLVWQTLWDGCYHGNRVFLWVWFLGELLSFFYVLFLPDTLHLLPLLFNYSANILGLLVVLRFAYWPDRRTSL